MPSLLVEGPPPLVDRVQETDRLRALLRDAKEGKGSLLVLRGEAGIGKTRLVQETLALGLREGFATGLGTCLSETVALYHPWQEALRPIGLAHVLGEPPPPLLKAIYVIASGGRLVAEAEREGVASDPDLFASMLTAVGDFLRDALGSSVDVEGPVLRMSTGKTGLVVRRAADFAIAALIEGHETEAFLDDLRDLAEGIGRKWGQALTGWDGQREKVVGMEAPLNGLLGSLKYRGAETMTMMTDATLRREVLFHNVLLGLQRKAEVQQVLLVLDDLQWSDPSSLALIHYVARNIRQHRVAILGTSRTEEGGSP